MEELIERLRINRVMGDLGAEGKHYEDLSVLINKNFLLNKDKRKMKRKGLYKWKK